MSFSSSLAAPAERPSNKDCVTLSGFDLRARGNTSNSNPQTRGKNKTQYNDTCLYIFFTDHIQSI